jgi:hypothetical protein
MSYCQTACNKNAVVESTYVAMEKDKFIGAKNEFLVLTRKRPRKVVALVEGDRILMLRKDNKLKRLLKRQIADMA